MHGPKKKYTKLIRSASVVGCGDASRGGTTPPLPRTNVRGFPCLQASGLLRRRGFSWLRHAFSGPQFGPPACFGVGFCRPPACFGVEVFAWLCHAFSGIAIRASGLLRWRFDSDIKKLRLGWRSFLGLKQLALLYERHALLECLFVEWQEVMVALGKGLSKSADNSVDFHDRAAFEERAQQYHIVGF